MKDQLQQAFEREGWTVERLYWDDELNLFFFTLKAETMRFEFCYHYNIHDIDFEARTITGQMDPQDVELFHDLRHYVSSNKQES